jgi:hypothetical protein
MPLVELKDLAYPLMRINAKHIQRFDSAGQLSVESDYFLERGAYETGTFLLTATGDRLDVLNCVKVRPSYSWKYWGARHRAWVIQLTLELNRNLSLEDARHMLTQLICDHAWHRQSDLSAKELKEYLHSAATFEDLYRRISFYGRW